jgi:hypothetical protein
MQLQGTNLCIKGDAHNLPLRRVGRGGREKSLYIDKIRFKIRFYCPIKVLAMSRVVTVIYITHKKPFYTIRYDNVTLIPLVLQLGLRIGPIQRMGGAN